MYILESILDDIEANELTADKRDISGDTDTLSPKHYHFCLAFPSPFAVTRTDIERQFAPVFDLYATEYNIVTGQADFIPENVRMDLHSTIYHPADVISRSYIEFNTRQNKLEPMFIITMGAVLHKYYNEDYIYPSVVVPDILHSENGKYIDDHDHKYFPFCISYFYEFLNGTLRQSDLKNTADGIFNVISSCRAMLLDPRDIKDYLTVRLKRRKELIKAKKAVKPSAGHERRQ